MQMSLFDYSLNDVAEMSGLERTLFMNDVLEDYQAAKSLRQSKMEKFYLELLKQLIKDYGN
jgi:hypothetical protein